MANKFDHLTATERVGAPSTPATGDWAVYFKSDGFYVIDDAGTETGPLSAGDLAAHLADTTDAHDASAISILDAAGDFTATDVEGALAELQADAEADATALSDHLADTVDAHDATAISFTPAGTIAATTVQAAIEEVATEAGAGGAIRVEDEGSSVVAAATGINFAGAGVTVTDAGSNEALVTIPGGGGSTAFKSVRLVGSGNKSITGTSYGAIDATNLPYQTLTLAVGDVVRCTFYATFLPSSGLLAIDFEVDQPTSANVNTSGNELGSCAMSNASGRQPYAVIDLFTATEAGVHGFRPVAKVGSGTGTIYNATTGNDETPIQFIVENLGTP